ncbi:hypothetical protein M514_21347, partial [Trichuris suis]
DSLGTVSTSGYYGSRRAQGRILRSLGIRPRRPIALGTACHVCDACALHCALRHLQLGVARPNHSRVTNIAEPHRRDVEKNTYSATNDLQ